MSKIYSDTTKNYDAMLEIITENNCTAEEVLNMFVNWHGTQVLTKDFLNNLVDCEGYYLDQDVEDEE